MGNLLSLHTWELNFGQTIRGKIEVLLGTSGGTIWELGNVTVTNWETHWEQGQNPTIAPSPLLKEKNWSPHEGRLSLLIGCMKLHFQSCLSSFLAWGNWRGHKLSCLLFERYAKWGFWEGGFLVKLWRRSYWLSMRLLKYFPMFLMAWSLWHGFLKSDQKTMVGHQLTPTLNKVEGPNS
jgi:hypothetical protein